MKDQIFIAKPFLPPEFEKKLIEELLPLPIDQRLEIKDKRYIIKNIISVINGIKIINNE